MIIGPKYKIARRLNAPVFEKTQTQKFAMSQAKKSKTKGRGPGQKTAYAEQMLEKQKARYTYLLTEKRFSGYVKEAIASKGHTVPTLYAKLERRLDNVVYRMGLSATRSGARQMVSHGHITVNGKRVTIPSFAVSEADRIGIREGSKNKPLFVGAADKMKNFAAPNWIKPEPEKAEAVIVGMPVPAEKTDALFDLNAVIEFYSR